MSRSALRRLAFVAVALAAVAVLAWALRPAPVSVDLAEITQGPMQVTLDEDGIAQIRDVFQVSAPIAGQLDRLPVHVGDDVVAGKTVVASIHASDPAFLDIRTRAELQAAVSAAQASVNLAQAQLESSVVARASAESKPEREGETDD